MLCLHPTQEFKPAATLHPYVGHYDRRQFMSEHRKRFIRAAELSAADSLLF